MSKFIAVCLLFIFASCSYTTHYVSPNRVVYPPFSAADVAISPQKRVSVPHKEVGRVAVIEWGDGDSALEKLRSEAARIGGNLVVDLKVEKTFGGVAASGLAVRLYQ